MAKKRSIKRKKKLEPHLHVRGVGERVPISHKGRRPARPISRPQAPRKARLHVGGTGGDTFLDGDENPFVRAVAPRQSVGKAGKGNGLKHATEPPLGSR